MSEAASGEVQGGGAFNLTEVANQVASMHKQLNREIKKFDEKVLLEQCHKENIKVKEVVAAFRSKIDNLIDKQV